MTPAQAAPAPHTWWLEPRDPLVFGDGSRIPALAPRHRFLLPPQGTLAGMVRTRFVAAQAEVSKEDARRLLDIHIRGPWLARSGGAGKKPELWLPVPADVVAVARGDGESYLPGELVFLTGGEGTLWPSPDGRPRALIRRTDRLEGGAKTSRPSFPFWPLEDVVHWSLRLGNGSLGAGKNGTRPIAPEYRVHVAIEDETWTAEPEALFSSAGLRYGLGFGLAVEVTDSRGLADQQSLPEGPPHLLVLGAESRTAACSIVPGPCFPSFDGPTVSWRGDTAGASPVQCPTFRDLYRRRIEELLRGDHQIGVRLQLLTPGAFGGWEPAWPEELRKKLLAVCMERSVPVSGWDLQAGRPRSVRRLVPAGSVYSLGPFGGAGESGTLDKVLGLCSEWWGRSLCDGEQGDAESFVAPPRHDGYGMVLPAPFGLPRRLDT